MGQSHLGFDDFMAAHEAVAKDVIYIPSQQRYARAASATNTERLASIQVRGR